MLKLLLKVAVAALIANAAVRVGAAYLVHVQFRDSVRQEMPRARSAADLQQRVLDVADSYELDVDPEGLTVEWAVRQRYVAGDYTKDLMLGPAMTYPWRFTWEIDGYVAPNDQSTSAQQPR